MAIALHYTTREWLCTAGACRDARARFTLPHTPPLSLFPLGGSSGWNLLKSGLAALRRLSPDMNSLVSTGVLTVYLSSVAALLNPSLGLTAAFHEPVCRPRMSCMEARRDRSIFFVLAVAPFILRERPQLWWTLLHLALKCLVGHTRRPCVAVSQQV